MRAEARRRPKGAQGLDQQGGLFPNKFGWVGPGPGLVGGDTMVDRCASDPEPGKLTSGGREVSNPSLVGLEGLPPAGVQVTPEGLGGRLAAAKPVAWKGRGELLQLPWPTPCSGLVLVVDLWSGLAGLLVALLALGVRFVAITAEMDNRLGGQPRPRTSPTP